MSYAAETITEKVHPETPISGSTGHQNVGSTERVISSVAGAALTVYGLTQKRDIGGATLAALGGYLLYRGVSGYCPGYAALRTGTSDQSDSPSAVIPHGQGIKVQKTMTIAKPAAELFAYWRNFENLPHIMDHLESVTVQDSLNSHWVAKAPLNNTVEWDAEIVSEIPGQMIAWRSTENAQIANAGSIQFKELSHDRGTEVRVSLEYNPPAGIIGATVAKLLGEEPKKQVEDDLRHFKQLMEAGEIATTKGQPQGGKRKE